MSPFRSWFFFFFLFVFFLFVCFFFFNDTATTEIYTLSLHDALPIFPTWISFGRLNFINAIHNLVLDRKSTRLNSSHITISYAVFCLKKKKNTTTKNKQKQKKKKQSKKNKNKRVA